MTTDQTRDDETMSSAAQTSTTGTTESGTGTASQLDRPRIEQMNSTNGTPTTCKNGDTPVVHEPVQKSQKRRGKPGLLLVTAMAKSIAAVVRWSSAGRSAGYGHVYRGVRERFKLLKPEWESKYGPMLPSQEDALSGACVWLVRARCLHKWARQPERTATELNDALGKAAECHDRYINRLRSIGLAKLDGSNGESGADSAWAALNTTKSGADLPPSLIDELTEGQQ